MVSNIEITRMSRSSSDGFLCSGDLDDLLADTSAPQPSVAAFRGFSIATPADNCYSAKLVFDAFRATPGLQELGLVGVENSWQADSPSAWVERGGSPTPPASLDSWLSSSGRYYMSSFGESGSRRSNDRDNCGSLPGSLGADSISGASTGDSISAVVSSAESQSGLLSVSGSAGAWGCFVERRSLLTSLLTSPAFEPEAIFTSAWPDLGRRAEPELPYKALPIELVVDTVLLERPANRVEAAGPKRAHARADGIPSRRRTMSGFLCDDSDDEGEDELLTPSSRPGGLSAVFKPCTTEWPPLRPAAPPASPPPSSAPPPAPTTTPAPPPAAAPIASAVATPAASRTLPSPAAAPCRTAPPPAPPPAVALPGANTRVNDLSLVLIAPAPAAPVCAAAAATTAAAAATLAAAGPSALSVAALFSPFTTPAVASEDHLLRILDHELPDGPVHHGRHRDHPGLTVHGAAAEAPPPEVAPGRVPLGLAAQAAAADAGAAGGSGSESGSNAPAAPRAVRVLLGGASTGALLGGRGGYGGDSRRAGAPRLYGSAGGGVIDGRGRGDRALLHSISDVGVGVSDTSVIRRESVAVPSGVRTGRGSDKGAGEKVVEPRPPQLQPLLVGAPSLSPSPSPFPAPAPAPPRTRAVEADLLHLVPTSFLLVVLAQRLVRTCARLPAAMVQAVVVQPALVWLRVLLSVLQAAGWLASFVAACVVAGVLVCGAAGGVSGGLRGGGRVVVALPGAARCGGGQRGRRSGPARC